MFHARLRREILHQRFRERKRSRRPHHLCKRDRLSRSLPREKFLKAGCDLVDEGFDGGVVGLGEDGVLAELNGVRRFRPDWFLVMVIFDTDDEVGSFEVRLRDPGVDGLVGEDVDVSPDTAFVEENEVAQEVGLQDRVGEIRKGCGDGGVEAGCNEVVHGVVGDALIVPFWVQGPPCAREAFRSLCRILRVVFPGLPYFARKDV